MTVSLEGAAREVSPLIVTLHDFPDLANGAMAVADVNVSLPLNKPHHEHELWRKSHYYKRNRPHFRPMRGNNYPVSLADLPDGRERFDPKTHGGKILPCAIFEITRFIKIDSLSVFLCLLCWVCCAGG